MKQSLMKKCLYLALCMGVLAVMAAPARAAVSASKELSDGAQFTVDGGTLRVQFWSPEIVRVTYAATNELPALKSLSVVASPEKARFKRQHDDRTFTLATSDIMVKIDRQTGTVKFSRHCRPCAASRSGPGSKD